MLSFQNFQIHLKNKSLMSPLNFECSQPCFISLSADSGSGKTSLFETLLGFRKDGYTGSFFIEKSISYVSQNSDLVENLTANENLLLADSQNRTLMNAMFGFNKMKIKSAQEALELFGIKNGEKKVFQLSGGEKQRVALARLLNSDKKIWLLDEPVSQLDIEMAKKSLQKVKDHARKNQILVLCILHHQDLVNEFSDIKLKWNNTWQID